MRVIFLGRQFESVITYLPKSDCFQVDKHPDLLRQYDLSRVGSPFLYLSCKQSWRRRPCNGGSQDRYLPVRPHIVPRFLYLRHATVRAVLWPPFCPFLLIPLNLGQIDYIILYQKKTKYRASQALLDIGPFGRGSLNSGSCYLDFSLGSCHGHPVFALDELKTFHFCLAGQIKFSPVFAPTLNASIRLVCHMLWNEVCAPASTFALLVSLGWFICLWTLPIRRECSGHFVRFPKIMLWGATHRLLQCVSKRTELNFV